MRYTKDKISKLIKDVFDGKVDINNLPVDLYNDIYDYFNTGLSKFNKELSASNINKLRKNIRDFSGSKTYSLINSMQQVIKESKDFEEFKETAKGIFDLYKNWGYTELNSVELQTQNVIRWEQIQEQKKDLPFLQYSIVNDDRTSDVCLELDGVTLPVDDAFWDKNTPQNHFNCRCVLIQLDELDAKVTTDSKLKEINDFVDDNKQDLFNDNVGKSLEIFPKNHPYFREDGDS